MADNNDIKRLNYFTGQFLEAQDFQDEQSYHIGMRRRLNQLLYSPGIVDGGFVVTKIGDKRIEVSAGFAIDANGRELILFTPQQKDVTGFADNATVFVAVRYTEPKEDDRSTENITGFIRITEKPEILLQIAQPTGNDLNIALLLAKLQLDGNGNVQSVDTSVRQLANLVFNGNKVGIGTLNPAEKLHISGGKLQLDGDQQINFTDTSTSTSLKLQLRSGCGLGVKDSNLYFASNTKYSWLDKEGRNERMSLSVAADGGLTVLGTGNSSFTGNLGVGAASPTNRLHIDKGRIDITTSDAIGGGQNRFNGLRNWDESPARRGQIVISSSYSDMVIASSEGNDTHGSTLTFAAYNPNNAAEYRKWVINQGNWGARKQFLEFGYSDAARSNPHENINGNDNVLALDGINKRVGIGTTNPQAKLDVRGVIRLQPDGSLFASGGVENLQIIRGFVNLSGLIIGGEGFKVSMDPPGPNRRDGVYLITFNKGFSAMPSVFAQVIYRGVNEDPKGGDTRDNAVIYSLTNNGMAVVTGNAEGKLTNKFFTFMAVGVPI